VAGIGREAKAGHSVTGGYVCRDKNLPDLNGRNTFWATLFPAISGHYANKRSSKENRLITKLCGFFIW